ncbi:GGDEF/EAL domain-containing response regulator [Aliikangiella coralliicola]|nr:GGDEF domain-containing response regulator [Aliikangiella coralliicola]
MLSHNQPLNILIVDDSQDDRFHLNRLINKMQNGSKLWEAEDLNESKQVLSHNDIDVLLVDYHLPDGVATDLLLELQNTPTQKPLGIIALTGLGNETIAVSLMKAGAHEYLVKGEITQTKLNLAITQSYKRAELSHQIQFLAGHDSLTGTVNRGLLNDRLSRAIARAVRQNTSLAIILMDVDYFKQVNDTFGHVVGDELLCHICKKIQSSIRASDTICRWGGDEFILLLENMSKKDTKIILDKLQSFSRQPLQTQEHFINYSLSMGCAFYPSDADSDKSLIRAADLALYKAKEKGKNQYYFFSNELKQSQKLSHSLVAEFPEALNSHAFYLLFQPIVDIKSKKWFALEALCRWKHPQMGDIKPDTFINLIEDGPLLIAFHRLFFKTICESLVLWRKEFNNQIPISINLPPKAINKTVIRLLVECVEQSSLNPSDIWIEITERQLFYQVPHALEILKELQSNGFSIIIDDFGTGHSSFKLLSELPLSGVKLDRFFVEDIETNLKHQAIIKSCINLCRELNLMLVVEGIEKRSQYEVLKNMDFSLAQGFYFDVPLTPSKVCELRRA